MPSRVVFAKGLPPCAKTYQPTTPSAAAMNVARTAVSFFAAVRASSLSFFAMTSSYFLKGIAPR